MKTQKIGECWRPGIRYSPTPHPRLPAGVASQHLIGVLSHSIGALKNYRDKRENKGSNQNLPSFPSAGFDQLDVSGVSSVDPESRGKWPDAEGKYWWRVVLNGKIVDGFYWMPDTNQGYPEKNTNGHDLWHFIVGHRDGTVIPGFCMWPDYESGFPQKSDHYYVRFNEAHSPAIRAYEAENDLNCLDDLQENDKVKYQQEITAHPDIYQKQLARQRVYHAYLFSPFPFTSPSKTMQAALEQQDIKTVRALIDRELATDKNSIGLRAWNMIGLDGKLSIDKEILVERGIITNVSNLYSIAQETLSAYKKAPDSNRRYLKRLLWGVNHLLEQWSTGKLNDIAADITLTEAAAATLQTHWQSSREMLSLEVINAIANAHRQRIMLTYEQWRAGKLVDNGDLGQSFDTITANYIWAQWKQGALRSELAQVISTEIERQLLERWKKHDLPADFEDGWKTKLVELLSEQFDARAELLSEQFDEQALDPELDRLVDERFKGIIQKRYGGRIPRKLNNESIYEEVFKQLINDWLADDLAQADKVAVLATSVYREMKISHDVRSCVKQAAISSIITQFKVGQFQSLESSVISVFEDSLIPICSNISRPELLPLQQEITTDTINTVLADWRAGKLDSIKQIQLLTLLPKWLALKIELETQVSLASKHEALRQKDERIAELEKAVAELGAQLGQPNAQSSSSSDSDTGQPPEGSSDSGQASPTQTPHLQHMFFFKDKSNPNQKDIDPKALAELHEQAEQCEATLSSVRSITTINQQGEGISCKVVPATPNGNCGFIAVQRCLQLQQHHATAEQVTRNNLIHLVEKHIDEGTHHPLIKTIFEQDLKPIDEAHLATELVNWKEIMVRSGHIWLAEHHLQFLSAVLNLRFHVYNVCPEKGVFVPELANEAINQSAQLVATIHLAHVSLQPLGTDLARLNHFEGLCTNPTDLQSARINEWLQEEQQSKQDPSNDGSTLSLIAHQ